MADTQRIKLAIPQSPQPIRLSRTAIGLLAATIVLAVLLTFSTLKNINRAQLLMENFLQDKGETILRSIEAGTRASMVMMHHINNQDPLHNLLIENSKGEDILFIAVVDTDGSIIDQAGHLGNAVLSAADIESLSTTGQATTRLNRKGDVFIYSKFFTIDEKMREMHMPDEERKRWQEQLAASNKIISVGLLTEEFDKARKQDARHALFMGAILFLVGAAGFYFLFLYQKMRITSAALADVKLYAEAIIESIPVSIISLDADNRIVSCNQNTEDLFGCTLDDLLWQPVEKAFPELATAISESCGSAFEQTAEGKNSEGCIIPLRISCSPLVNHDDASIGKVLVIRDMSSIRNMEIQIERSRRMAALGKMAAGIAHEIRNPLGTLRGFAQFFGSKPEATEDDKMHSSLMVNEIDRLNHTVSGLLQFSRPREPHLRRLSIDALFAKTITLMKADLANHDVRFHCPRNTGIEYTGDPDLLLQVLVNLLKNSINAIASGGDISLSCKEDDHHIRISVIDSGCGMSERERERMFDPFFTTTRTGTGLGLAVSHQIIEQHHGTFEVITEKNTGTTITMVLPK
ncbi:two-component system sensor histidine kinase NtrB [Desulfosediminicola flagellatus]|uniref:two-component system sensor histidine kinase NtrB n=1 Tax=Desulfosediminicola flagellatus TaxID=2569541 RepID=UPI00142EE026|nr:ATP-binding protein [Desulfosediminicola flagellatus]